MRKLILLYVLKACWLLVGVTMFTPFSRAAGEAVLYIDPPRIEGVVYVPSTNVNIAVLIANVNDLHSLSFNISYAPQILSYRGHTIGSLDYLPRPKWQIDDEKGYVWFNITYGTPITTTSPVMLVNVTLWIQIRGETIFDLHDTRLLNSGGDSILHLASDGYFINFNPYDLNLDRVVDIQDIAMVAYAFGSYPGHPRWNPDVDFNDDGKVDIRDLALIAGHFGEY